MRKVFALPLTLIGVSVLAMLVMARPAGPAIAVEPVPTRSAAITNQPMPPLHGNVVPSVHKAIATANVTPTVIFVNPAAGARAVPTHTLVAATFSRDMDPGTINGDTFLVSQGAMPVGGSVSYIAVSKVAVFDPGTPLAPGTAYTATITTGTQSASGVPLAQGVVWSFTTTDGPPPLDDGMRIYFGGLHSHSGYSDGTGTPADAFATARANGLDFFALTDHSSLLTAEEWQDMLVQASTATVDGEFVGLRGFEFTHLKGHINVFDTDTYVSENDPNYDTLEKFYAWLAAQPTAIGQFDHPAKVPGYDWNFNDFAYHAGADSKIHLRETPGYPSDQYLLSLNAGWHVGALNSSDTHDAGWGRWRLMGLVAPGLTEDAILDALRARRTFSVYDRNFALLMQANGHWMGAVISATSTIHFTVTAYDPDPTDPILALILYDNGVPVTSTILFSAPVLYTWTPTIAGTPGHYYYVKAYHDVDGVSYPAYTSPIWMDTSPVQWENTYLPAIMWSSGSDGQALRPATPR